MKYDTSDKTQRSEAMRYFMTLANKHYLVEIKRINPNRSLKQNSYLHLLLGAFGAHFGYTLDEAKQIYKELNGQLYYYEKKGRRFKRSSADLDTAEMTTSIDRFRERSAEAGCPLPAPTDQAWLREIENEIERSKHYL